MPRNSRENGLITTDLRGGTLTHLAQALRLSGRLVIYGTGIADQFDKRISAPREFLVIEHVERPTGN